MDYEAFFAGELDALRQEGRYRVFADLERHAGRFPAADAPRRRRGSRMSRCGARTTIWAWASIRLVLAAMHEALDSCGAGAGGTRNISGTNHYHVLLERELADLHGKQAALLFTSGYVSNWAALGTLASRLPGLRRPVRRAQPCLDDRGHPPQPRRMQRLQAQRSGRSRPQAVATLEPGRPKLVAFESVYSMDGDIAPIAEICDVADAPRRHDLSRRSPWRRAFMARAAAASPSAKA